MRYSTVQSIPDRHDRIPTVRCSISKVTSLIAHQLQAVTPFPFYRSFVRAKSHDYCCIIIIKEKKEKKKKVETA